MASFSPSQKSLMLIATGQRGRMVAICICLLLFAGGSSARSQLEELQSHEKEELVFYVHEDEVPPDVTIIRSAPPSGTTREFGTIFTINDVIREGIAKDSIPLGFVKGLFVIEKDLPIYVTVVNELTTPGRTGTLTAQGVLDPNGNGEVAITGGTGTYRWAQGYIEVVNISTDPADFILKDTVHLKYF